MSSEMRVTDAMVEAACIASRGNWGDLHHSFVAKVRENMRAALEAALLARTEAGADGADGAVESNGPEFTDWARAALSWVLYHHQGGSSPVGQPIRFALGMGANERLPDWRIADGKRWAAQTGSTTADFHTHPQDASGDAERICDYLCEQEYDIGGRDELLAHIRAALFIPNARKESGVNKDISTDNPRARKESTNDAMQAKEAK
jgi:hypothetical protein